CRIGANPRPALALEEIPSLEDLLPTLEAILRVQDHYGNRDNKLRARMKWLVDTMGIDELRERIFKERKFLPASATYPGGVPAVVTERGDAPAGMGTEVNADGGLAGAATPVEFRGLSPFAQWDVVSCPGADTCNLAVTQSRGLADDIGVALEKAGLAEVGGVRVNISGCTNSCGQHHIADIGFVGIERRAHGRAAPGYHMLLGGR